MFVVGTRMYDEIVQTYSAADIVAEVAGISRRTWWISDVVRSTSGPGGTVG